MINIRIIININLIILFLFNLINLNFITIMFTFDKRSINENLKILNIKKLKIEKKN